MQDGDNFYMASASAITVYKILEGYSDDGANIETNYEQELNMGDLTTAQQLLGCYVQGRLSPSSEITISFDVYNRRGIKAEDKLSLLWKVDTSSTSSDGYGGASWASSAWGGNSDESGLTECFDGIRKPINDYQRIILKMTEISQTYYEVIYFRALTRQKAPIRRRTLTIS
jgi:hypothetical protein